LIKNNKLAASYPIIFARDINIFARDKPRELNMCASKKEC